MATSSKKQWVFKRLVQDENDLIGLLAYSLYKCRKTEIADKHRARNATEAEINTQLALFHDQTVLGETEIKNYRVRGQALFNNLVETSRADLQKELEQAKLRHKKELADARRKAIDDLAATVKKSKSEQANKWLGVGLWFVSAIPGSFATMLWVVLIYGIAMYFTPEAQRSAAVANMVNAVTGEKSVVPAAPASPAPVGAPASPASAPAKRK